MSFSVLKLFRCTGCVFQAMDTFICGTCQGAFNDIEVFMQHKQAGCSRPSPEIIQVHVDGSGEVTEVTGSESVMGNYVLCKVMHVIFL